MLTEPKTVQRKEQHYLAIRKKVHMQDIPDVLPPLVPEVLTFLEKNNIQEDGPVFFLYRSISEENELDTEVGCPVKTHENGNGHITSGVFPEGKYATITFIGDYRNMKDGHMALEAWIDKMGLKEKRETSGGTQEWGGRAEFYLNGPDEEPDPKKWETEIVFLLEE